MDAHFSPLSPETVAWSPVAPDELLTALSKIPFFRNLSLADCHHLAPLLRAREFTPGSILFYEDDPSNDVFFLASGAVEVFKSNAKGKKLPLLILRDGGVLGEIGLLIGEPRTATARALDSVRVFGLQRDDYERATQNGDAGAVKLTLCMARVLASRLRATDSKLFDLFESDVSEALLRQLSETRAKLLGRWVAPD